MLKEIVGARDGCTDGRTMDDGQWAITKAHLEHFVCTSFCTTDDGRWTKTDHNSSKIGAILMPK